MEVAAAWQEVIGYGSDPSQLQITCGRHCYENWVYNENTRYIIDVTGLRDFGADSSYGFYIGAGFGNWDMYRMFCNLYNRTIPAGSCYSVGLGGHITGGGYGLLSRQFGLSIDHVSAVEIVVLDNPGVSPSVITASRDTEPDLFWALRGGGGGNFGIITRYYFENPPTAPTSVFTNAYTIDWSELMSIESFQVLLSSFSRQAASGQAAPDPRWDILFANHIAAGSVVWATYVFDVPDEDKVGSDYEHHVRDQFVEQEKQLREIVKLSSAPGSMRGHPYYGDSSSLRAVGTTNACRNLTFLEGMQNANGSGPNRFGKYKSAYMNKQFTTDPITLAMAYRLHEGLQRVPGGVSRSDMAASLVQFDSYGCAINANIKSSDTAIAQRSSILKLQYQTYWDNSSQIGKDDPAQQVAHLNWIRGLYSEVYDAFGGYPNPALDPSGTVDGCYYNYCDNDLNDGGGVDFAMDLYFEGNLARLKSVKSRYNPNNWFNGPQSIPLV